MSEKAVEFGLLRQLVGLRIRILKNESDEQPEYSSQQLTCHVHREDIPTAAFGLIFALGALSFHDARPRGSSHIDYDKQDEWTIGDMLEQLRYERGQLVFDADYVRGRMMKTTVKVHSNGRVVIRTRNRHEQATRWVQRLQGKQHLRLVGGGSGKAPPPVGDEGGGSDAG